MTSELYIADTLIDLEAVENFPITYSIADVKNPTKRQHTTSKTIELPGTSTNLKFFASAYQLSIDDPNNTGLGFDFDPTLQYTARYYRNGSLIFNGSMRLLRVKNLRGAYTIEIVVFSTYVSIDKELGSLLISELGWDEYTHVLNLASVQASWAAAVGSGYVYGAIDYGFTTDISNLQIQTNQLIPHVYQFEILQKAFAYLGFTIDSDTLNSPAFKKKTWGSGGGFQLQLDVLERNNRGSDFVFEHDYDGSIVNPTTIIVGPTNTLLDYAGFTTETINFIGFTKYTIGSDTYNQIGNSGGGSPSLDGIITVANTGDYRITFDINSIDLTATHTGTANVSLLLKLVWEFVIFKNGLIVGTSGKFKRETSNPNFVESVSSSFNVDTHLNAGDIIQMGLFTNVTGSRAITSNASAPPSLYDNFTLTIRATTNSIQDLEFQIASINSELQDGDNVLLARHMPPVKVAEFINDIVTTHNLHVSEPDEDNVIKIETFDLYYFPTNVANDWTKKVARDKLITIDPPKIEAKNYRFKFAQDNDYYNSLYRETFGKGYGDYNLEINTNLTNGEKVWQVHFAQTIPVQIAAADLIHDALIMPRIVKVDPVTNAATPFKGKPRVFNYNGLQDCVTWELLSSDGLTSVSLNEYPQMHHLDDLLNPTFDYNFGKPDFLYYITSVFSNNNLVQEFYVSFLTELTNKAAKTANLFVKITEADLKGDFMRFPVNIDGVIYRKNLIKEFEALKNELTKVELIKVIEGRKPNTSGQGQEIPTSDDAIESLIGNGPDYHSGWSNIKQNKIITILEDKQSVAYSNINIEGRLNIEGELIIEE